MCSIMRDLTFLSKEVSLMALEIFLSRISFLDVISKGLSQ